MPVSDIANKAVIRPRKAAVGLESEEALANGSSNNYNINSNIKPL